MKLTVHYFSIFHIFFTIHHYIITSPPHLNQDSDSAPHRDIPTSPPARGWQLLWAHHCGQTFPHRLLASGTHCLGHATGSGGTRRNLNYWQVSKQLSKESSRSDQIVEVSVLGDKVSVGSWHVSQEDAQPLSPSSNKRRGSTVQYPFSKKKDCHPNSKLKPSNTCIQS